MERRRTGPGDQGATSEVDPLFRAGGHVAGLTSPDMDWS
jgi:hypothetical protein